MQKFLKFDYKTLRNVALQLLLFAIIFNAVSFWRESSLLPADGDYQAPTLSLPRLNGEMFDHNQLAGNKTIIYFFAPWCTVCHLSIHNLESFYQDEKGDVNVVGIALSYDSRNEVDEFVKDKALSFPILMGTNELMTEYKINGFPSYYVLDEQGRIAAKSQGYSTEMGLRLRALL